MSKRRKSQLPQLKVNAKGEFYINYRGKKVYMGRKVETAKARLLDFLQHPDRKKENGSRQRQQKVEVVSIDDLIGLYSKELTKRGLFKYSRASLAICSRMYGACPTDEFGVPEFKHIRTTLKETLRRTTINSYMDTVKRMLEFGSELGLVPEDILFRIVHVRRLREGEAKDSTPRQDIDDDTVLRTLPFLSPTMRDMIVLQRITGMRPGELLRMRLCEIMRDGPIWVYIPEEHKTAKRGKSRPIALGAHEIEIIKRHSEGKAESEYIFRNRWGRPLSSGCYRYALVTAIRKAQAQGVEIPQWTPYQLRHSCATFLSLMMGEQSAATALGHASTKTTQRYDHSAVAKAIRLVAARDGVELPKLESFQDKLEG